jgi:hypothetical protein
VNGSPTPIDFSHLQKVSFVVGGVATVAMIIGAFFNLAQFFRAYLFAYLFWAGVPLGCLALLMLYHLVGGSWGMVVRNLIESATWTLPLMLILFVPLFFGLKNLYPWAHPELVAASETLRGKTVYLNAPFFIGRTIFYFAIFLVLARVMKQRAAEHPENTEASPSAGLRVWSGWGLVLYCLFASFAGIDWVMSLEPEWFSTVYGMLFVTGHALTATATLILLLAFLGEGEQLKMLFGKPLLDLGNLLLTWVILWIYLAFMQFLIVWSGNLKEEIPWYLRRSHGAWPILIWALFVLHFLAPFLLLLSRAAKNRVRRLAAIAACLWLARFVEYFWQLGPLPGREKLPLHWLYFATPIALGGIWFGFFLGILQKRTRVVLLPREEEMAA